MCKEQQRNVGKLSFVIRCVVLPYDHFDVSSVAINSCIPCYGSCLFAPNMDSRYIILQMLSRKRNGDDVGKGLF